MADFCMECNKKIGIFEDYMYLDEGVFLCQNCANIVRDSVGTISSVYSYENFLEKKDKIMIHCKGKFNNKTIIALFAKLVRLYNNNKEIVTEPITLESVVPQDLLAEIGLDSSADDDKISKSISKLAHPTSSGASSTDLSGFAMFDNIGGKIKILAVIVTWIGIICSVISGLLLMSTGYSETVLIGILVACLGSLFSWIGSFLLYGFGQLIENTDKLVKKMDK